MKQLRPSVAKKSTIKKKRKMKHEQTQRQDSGNHSTGIEKEGKTELESVKID